MTEIRMYQNDVPTRDKLSAVEPYQWFFVEIAGGQFLGQKVDSSEPYLDLQVDSDYRTVVFGIDKMDMEFMSKTVCKDTIVTVVKDIEFNEVVDSTEYRNRTNFYVDKRVGVLYADMTSNKHVNENIGSKRALYLLDNKGQSTWCRGNPSGVWRGSFTHLKPVKKLEIMFDI